MMLYGWISNDLYHPPMKKTDYKSATKVNQMDNLDLMGVHQCLSLFTFLLVPNV